VLKAVITDVDSAGRSSCCVALFFQVSAAVATVLGPALFSLCRWYLSPVFADDDVVALPCFVCGLLQLLLSGVGLCFLDYARSPVVPSSWTLNVSSSLLLLPPLLDQPTNENHDKVFFEQSWCQQWIPSRLLFHRSASSRESSSVAAQLLQHQETIEARCVEVDDVPQRLAEPLKKKSVVADHPSKSLLPPSKSCRSCSSELPPAPPQFPHYAKTRSLPSLFSHVERSSFEEVRSESVPTLESDDLDFFNETSADDDSPYALLMSSSVSPSLEDDDDDENNVSYSSNNVSYSPSELKKELGPREKNVGKYGLLALLHAIALLSDEAAAVAEALLLPTPKALGGAGLSAASTGLLLAATGALTLLVLVRVGFPLVERHARASRSATVYRWAAATLAFATLAWGAFLGKKARPLTVFLASAVSYFTFDATCRKCGLVFLLAVSHSASATALLATSGQRVIEQPSLFGALFFDPPRTSALTRVAGALLAGTAYDVFSGLSRDDDPQPGLGPVLAIAALALAGALASTKRAD